MAVPASVVNFEFFDQATSVQFSDDGSSQTLAYGPVLARLRQSRQAARLADEREHIGDYIRCQEESVSRGGPGTGQEDQTVSKPSGEYVASPEYKFPRDEKEHGDGFGPQTDCICDAATNPCLVSAEEAGQAKQFICQPDNQHGLILKHPGTAAYCWESQLLRFDSYSKITGGQGENGMYYPIVCQGVPIGDHPDGSARSATCLTGMRELVWVEPDNMSTDTQIGIGDLVVQFLASYDGYMQRNEEAHCCIDNRIACVDAHVWGGVQCWNGNKKDPVCTYTIMNALRDLAQELTLLAQCCAGIKEGEGKTANCPIPEFDPDFDGCGPC